MICDQCSKNITRPALLRWKTHYPDRKISQVKLLHRACDTKPWPTEGYGHLDVRAMTTQKRTELIQRCEGKGADKIRAVDAAFGQSDNGTRKQLERDIIGGLLAFGSGLDECGALHAWCFDDPMLGLLWATMSILRSEGKPYAGAETMLRLIADKRGEDATPEAVLWLMDNHGASVADIRILAAELLGMSIPQVSNETPF